MKLAMACAAGALLCAAPVQAQDTTALTPRTLQAALDAKPTGADAERLAERIRKDFGGPQPLAEGAPAKIDELLVAFAIETPPLTGTTPTPVRVSSDAVLFAMTLTRVGTTNVYAGVAPLAHGTAFTWHYEIGTRHLGGGQLEAYETHPDSKEQPGVPKGTVKQMTAWKSTIFTGTTRDWWVACRRSIGPSPAR